MGLESMNLLRPLKVGPITLPNRVVMGSMHTGLEGHPERFDQLARFYAERAKGLVGLIVTGGFAPNFAGRMKDEPGTLESEDQVAAHNTVTSAVHAAGGRIVVQLLHAGRYGYHSAIVAPSAVKSPINKDIPRELSDSEIEQTIDEGNEPETKLLVRQIPFAIPVRVRDDVDVEHAACSSFDRPGRQARDEEALKQHEGGNHRHERDEARGGEQLPAERERARGRAGPGERDDDQRVRDLSGPNEIRNASQRNEIAWEDIPVTQTVRPEPIRQRIVDRVF